VRDEIGVFNIRNGEDFQGELPAPMPSLAMRGRGPMPEDVTQNATKEPQRFRSGQDALMVLQWRGSRASYARERFRCLRFASKDRVREWLQRAKRRIVHTAGVVGHSPNGPPVASASRPGQLTQLSRCRRLRLTIFSVTARW
jgi:hypothetical protein